jgi:hypothetical protein
MEQALVNSVGVSAGADWTAAGMLAVLETAAHLGLPVMRGRLRATVSDGTTGYIPR